MVIWLTSLLVILFSPNVVYKLHSKGLEKGCSVLHPYYLKVGM